MSSLSFKRFQEKERQKNKYNVSNQDKKNIYLNSGNLKFTIEYGQDRNKMVGVDESGFRSFAYFTSSEDDAKTAILMEYKVRNSL